MSSMLAGMALQGHCPGIGEAGHLDNALQNLVRDGLIDGYGHGGGQPRGVASDCHVADVDPVLAEDSPDLTDHARLVLVADEERVLLGNYVYREAEGIDDPRLHPGS